MSRLLGELRTFQTDPLGYITERQREHGDIVRFRLGPYPVWQFSHPDTIRDVLMTSADHFRKGMVLQRAKAVLGDGLLTAETDVHRRHRKLVQPAFQSRRITAYAEVMVDRTFATVDRWTAGVPLDMHTETVRATLETAASTLLGADLEADAATVERAVRDLLKSYRLAFVPYGELLLRLPFGPARPLHRGRKDLYELIERMVADRKTNGEDRGDLLSALVLADDDERLDDVSIRDEATTMLLAGHETTANTLAFTFHLLAHHPDTEARVHAEIDDVLGGHLPSPDDADRLPVCRAVVSEALRLYPPSWLMGRQAVTEYRPATDTVVAAGDLVMLPQWVVHHDPRWWPDPERFDPDRWLDPDPDRPRWAYFPFGAGLRRCIGEGFAWTEAVLALATIAGRWRLRPVPGRMVELDPLITLRPRDGVWLTPEARRR